jgi:predicted PurR-regulated permease PerM
MKKITNITQSLFLIVLVLTLLIFLKGLLIPFAYGLLFALIVYPVCKKLENKKMPRPLAIFISVFLVTIVLGFIVFIFVLQIKALNKEIPELSNRLNQFLSNAQKWINANWGLSIIEQDKLAIDLGKNIFSNIGQAIKGSFSVAFETIFNLIIIPLYAILILYYRGVLINFISTLIGEKYRQDLAAILSETIHIYFNYMKGMFFVYILVGILNCIGLLILGVDYAILLGMVTAFMTIIPYFGIIISAILPMALVWAETNNILYPLGVVFVFAVVQYLEANIIFPYIVGKQLGINTLISIVSIVAGGVIWGVQGMILFLPFVAFLKIISGHIETLKPLYNLLEIPN